MDNNERLNETVRAFKAAYAKGNSKAKEKAKRWVKKGKTLYVVLAE
jgi:predicted secreted protein